MVQKARANDILAGIGDDREKKPKGKWAQPQPPSIRHDVAQEFIEYTAVRKPGAL